MMINFPNEVLYPQRTERTYRPGDIFRISNSCSMLCQVGTDEMCLVNLSSGLWRKPPITVNNTDRVTESEVHKMTSWKFVEYLGRLTQYMEY